MLQGSVRGLLDELASRLNADVPDRVQLGALVRKYREALGLTSAEFASRIRVAQQTVLRWERGLIARGQIKKLELAIDVAPTAQPFARLDSQFLAIRPHWYILARQRDADRVWIVKASRFLAGYSSGMRFELLDAARDRPGLQFNFVFPNKPEDAKKSFKAFSAFLGADRYSEIRKQFRGVKIRNAEAARRLGLGLGEVAVLIIEYSESAYDGLKRERDVFIETPVAILQDPERNVTDPMEYRVWIELPFQRADDLWATWKPLLTSRQNEVMLVDASDSAEKLS